MLKPGIIRKYRPYLPQIADEHIVTLGEGDTPLIRATVLEEVLKSLGADLKVYLKFEGANPTGSFKDRGMTMAISEAKSRGIKKVICASTGNTSASAAAYAARAEMECEVYLPKGKVAAGKLAQAKIYGAKIVTVDGNFDDALTKAREEAKKDQTAELVNSTNPFRLQGQKTAAFEICDDLLAMPAYHCIPVGNGGNVTAYWMGYQEYLSGNYSREHFVENLGNRLPRMLGFQAAGAAPIVNGQLVAKPETVATAIRIGNPVHWQNVRNAVQESKGGIFAVTDKEILYAYALLATKEQVFCEPASAASVAGLINLALTGKVKFQAGETAVCTLTGHGLKDPDTAAEITDE